MELSQDPLPGRSALVVYGSDTGNAQDLAEELGRIAERLRFQTQVAELNDISLKDLIKHDVVLFAISTAGQGELPPNARLFWKSLLSARLRPGCLQRLRFASFGLGDSTYSKFNWAHRKLYNRLVQLGAHPICDKGESDDDDPDGVDGAFLNWSVKLKERVLQEYPLPEDVVPISDEVLLEPKWKLEFIKPPTETNGTNGSHINENQVNSETKEEDIPDDDLLSIPNSLIATLEQNDRITPPAHWQDVRHLTFTIPPTPYLPGDTLNIHPKNFPSDITHFLSIMRWTSIADTPLHFVPSNPHTPPSQLPPLPLKTIDPTRPLTLRLLLANHLDIMSIPRRSFFVTMAHHTSDTYHRERLHEFTQAQYIDELYDYTTRPRRSILEVLQEFESVKLPWAYIASIIPGLRSRQFSIASGGVQKTGRSAPQPVESGVSGGGVGPAAGERLTRVELAIAVVKYRTVIKRIRQGVCTRYIATLRPGQHLSVTLQRGSLSVSKSDITRPVVMVGPGTGVAPMRALVYERMQDRAELLSENGDSEDRGDKEGKEGAGLGIPGDVLFFGCRNREKDYLFGAEWEALQREGRLGVFTAFSRDQREKEYVQDHIRREASRVFDAIHNHNALVYICGSAGKMPKSVKEAFIAVVEKEGHVSRDAAVAYVAMLEKQGRYKEETW